ncbi:PilZ domain-containing protein, partial [bacterium]|nr:PilZ domain-containing protein [bacterium]
MHKDAEKRKHLRLPASYVTRYRLRDSVTDFHVSQTQNVSQRGGLLFTNRMFKKGLQLELQIQFPFSPKWVTIIATVIACEEVTKSLSYKTRLQFLRMDEWAEKGIREIMERRKRMG